MEYGSKEICKAAVRLALSEGREEEKEMKNYYLEQGIKTVAVDFGSDFNSAVPKIIERAVVAAKREGLIAESHAEEGAVAGAAAVMAGAVYMNENKSVQKTVNNVKRTGRKIAQAGRDAMDDMMK